MYTQRHSHVLLRDLYTLHVHGLYMEAVFRTTILVGAVWKHCICSLYVSPPLWCSLCRLLRVSSTIIMLCGYLVPEVDCYRLCCFNSSLSGNCLSPICLCISVASTRALSFTIGASSSVNCTNTDECVVGSHTCRTGAFQCVDTIGSFTCHCPPGYGGMACRDVDECSSPVCSDYAACQNTIGNYSCSCRPGFSGSGQSCGDIDECASITLNTCTRLGASCVNTIGSHVCSCPVGYTGKCECRCDGICVCMRARACVPVCVCVCVCARVCARG